MNNFIGIIISAIYITLVIVSSKFVNKFGEEASRKYVHILLSNVWIIYLFFIDSMWAACVLPIAFVFINLFSYKFKLIKSIEREKNDGLGTVYYAVSMLIASIISYGVGCPIVGASGILIMGYGDGLAAIVGKKIKSQKYKIYISALTVLNMDRYTRISSGDTRLIRRIVRDHQFRGYSAKHTLKNWKMVTRGETKNIFPFQEDANTIFNTSLIYELGVLKGLAIPMLKEVKKEDEEYAEAERLINVLKYIKTIPTEDVPSNSLLKEFVGGGNFKY